MSPQPPQPDSESGTKSASSSTVTGWMLGLFAALVFYILSPGPLVAIYGMQQDRSSFPNWALAYVRPLTWCCERSEWIATAYDKYLDLWSKG